MEIEFFSVASLNLKMTGKYPKSLSLASAIQAHTFLMATKKFSASQLFPKESNDLLKASFKLLAIHLIYTSKSSSNG
jgi:hypothetical protein